MRLACPSYKHVKNVRGMLSVDTPPSWHVLDDVGLDKRFNKQQQKYITTKWSIHFIYLYSIC